MTSVPHWEVMACVPSCTGIEGFPWEATSNFLPGKRKLGKRDINILEVEVIN